MTAPIPAPIPVTDEMVEAALMEWYDPGEWRQLVSEEFREQLRAEMRSALAAALAVAPKGAA